jgi:hypothetical protein
MRTNRDGSDLFCPNIYRPASARFLIPADFKVQFFNTRKWQFAHLKNGLPIAYCVLFFSLAPANADAHSVESALPHASRIGISQPSRDKINDNELWKALITITSPNTKISRENINRILDIEMSCTPHICQYFGKIKHSEASITVSETEETSSGNYITFDLSEHPHSIDLNDDFCFHKDELQSNEVSSGWHYESIVIGQNSDYFVEFSYGHSHLMARFSKSSDCLTAIFLRSENP